jgi:hypothetical protein
MRRRTFVQWVVCLVIGFLCCPTMSGAAAEGISCTPEPTDMIITYGDLITCKVESNGDSDIFRFSGISGESITIISSNQDGFVQPCIELYNPDGTIAGQGCTWPAYTNRIDVTLIQTGSHTILLKDDENDNTGAYLIALQCLAGPCVIFPTPDIVGRIEVGGQPFVGAPVILRQPRKLPQETTTDANGEYQFDNILQGSFSIIIKGVK